MRAVVWKDWMLIKRSWLFWAMGAFLLIFFIVFSGVFVDMVRSTMGPDTAAIAVLFFGPYTGYFPPVLTVTTLYTNLNSNSFVVPKLRSDATEESVRNSGRSMITYCIAKAILPMIMAFTLSAVMIVFLLYVGALTASMLLSPRVLGGLAGAIIMSFTGEQTLLVSHAQSSGMFTLVMMITTIPLIVVLILEAMLPYWAVIAILFALGIIGLTGTIVECHRRYPNTLRLLMDRTD